MELNRRALALSRRTDDRHEEAVVLVNLGHLLRLLGQLAQATDHAREALAIFRDIDDRYGQVEVLHHLSLNELHAGRPDAALGHAGHARDLAQLLGAAYANDTLGAIHTRLGHHSDAVDCHRAALLVLTELRDRDGEMRSLAGPAAALAAGEPTTALSRYTTALTIAEELDDPAHQARVHTGLAAAHRACGNTEQAEHHRRAAAAHDARCDHPHADHSIPTSSNR
jgi:tetratricopeptide (TPR) repeat protein